MKKKKRTTSVARDRKNITLLFSNYISTSDKSNLLKKVDFLLKRGFQVVALFISFEVRYLVIIVVSFVYKWAQEYFRGIQNNVWLVCFWNIFPIGDLMSLLSRGFTIFQSRIPKWLLSNCKTVNTCEN